ncbi:MAG TPA: hypothetical protein PLO78_06440 [Candidatus Omnitrophota bacterium]|nr:hypothetical protein [Candidatus Omnitrophota bacterium]
MNSQELQNYISANFPKRLRYFQVVGLNASDARRSIQERLLRFERFLQNYFGFESMRDSAEYKPFKLKDLSTLDREMKDAVGHLFNDIIELTAVERYYILKQTESASEASSETEHDESDDDSHLL